MVQAECSPKFYYKQLGIQSSGCPEQSSSLILKKAVKTSHFAAFQIQLWALNSHHNLSSEPYQPAFNTRFIGFNYFKRCSDDKSKPHEKVAFA
jgi:hypothetical protein